MIKQEMVVNLNKQLNLELFSSNLYLQMSSWCNSNKLEGSSKFFKQQSIEETSHMHRLFDYLIDSGNTPKISSIDSPPEHFPSLKEIVQFSYEHEKMISKKIKNLSFQAIDTKDYLTFHFLKWYVEEQCEEEKMFKSILDRIELVNEDPSGLYFVDQILKKINNS
ncbi:ftn [Wigglesworthia glossinidia endosymbiont of Glossina brevipalpis]|uniref:Ferritin n=1 Tax=Wigglesworthia glossinidia brevipalpis TaxID=36870 RepID=Q8D2Y7_WIGBR|nr:ftn [Wigglesworthia glossinidia endosymbiont of Glossina brevipalpis]